MNCISSLKQAAATTSLLLLLIAHAACNAEVPAAKTYAVNLHVEPSPIEGTVTVAMQVSQARNLLRQVTFSVDERFSDISGDGDVSANGKEVVWLPPATGGVLRWSVRVNTRRGDAFDAYLDAGWGLFRAEDIVPRAAVRATVGSESVTTMSFDLPAEWSVTTAYPERKGLIRVARPERRFDLPTGWIVVGKLGTRIDQIGSTRVLVSGPVGQGVRRIEMLALLNWTLPPLQRLLPEPPQRLTIISAGDPMWRGGLSAPTSLFLHAEVPLISENATSLLLHEVMHVVMNLDVRRGHDWIQEGFAEYYSIELLRRSGGLSEQRFTTAIDDARRWGQSVRSLCSDQSSGATTAGAVALLDSLDTELGQHRGLSIDALFTRVLELDGEVDTPRLIAEAETLLASTSDVLKTAKLDDCRNEPA